MELREQSYSDELAGQDVALNPEADKATDDYVMTTDTAVEEDTDQSTDTPRQHLSKDELLAAVKEISEKEGAEISRDEVTRLKQAFYVIRKNELEVEKQAFLERGNEEAAFAAMPDPVEEQFQEVLKIIRDKKALYIAALENERKENLAKKLNVIEELGRLSEDTDNINRTFPRFRELTQEFKAIGEVPPTDTTEVYRNYNAAVERFYDQLKINKDLRDYDFKKNLEQKQLLIDEAEKLGAESDVIIAFRRLQELHDKWRDAGPVAKDIREEIWTRFKDASAIVNKRYQDFFEERKAKERENENKKTQICDRVEALDFSSLKSYAAWEEMTRTILEAQEEWKKLGFASRKVNNALFARFRATCDKFFAAKADFFKSVRESQSANLEKKIALCERAEALKESTDWKKTADVLVELQKEWKKIGAVDKKHSDAVWKRFQEACDTFFDRRKAATTDTRKIEHANLKAKNEIVAKIKAIAPDTSREDAMTQVKSLMAEWQQIGHVPYRDKEKAYNNYREAVNEAYERFDLRETRAHKAQFTSNIEDMAGDSNRLGRERERLMRAYEQKRSELKTYENNMGFLSVTSKSGNSLLRDMERKMQRIKDDIAALQEKIKLIDSKL